MINDYRDSSTLRHLNSMAYGSIPFIGMGKSGKTMAMYSCIEICPELKNRRKAFFDFPDVSIFPSSFRAYSVNDFDDIEPDSIAIFEDANRLFASRDSKNSRNMELQKFMGVISHKDILCMFTLQNTGNADQCIFRDQQVLNIHKMADTIGLLYERDEFRDYCQNANIVIPRFSLTYRRDIPFLSYIPKFSEILDLDPPEWYGKQQSCALRDYKILKKGDEKCKA
jgi:hypothetical protein